MNLHHLEIFAAVVREGSVTAGAQALHLSQPAVSRQLRQLEDELGVLLLARQPRGVVPTGAGAELARYAERIFLLAREAEAAMAAHAGVRRGRLVVGASTTIADHLLPDLLAALRRRHPELGLQAVVGNTEQVQTALRDGAIEIGLTEGADVDTREFDATPFRDDEMVLIASPQSPLAAGKGLPAAALAGLPLLAREPGSGSRDVVERALAAAGVPFTPDLTLGSTEAIRNAVAAGLGVALISRLAAERDAREGRVAIIPVPDLQARRTLYALGARGRPLSPAAQAFCALLRGTDTRAPQPIG